MSKRCYKTMRRVWSGYFLFLCLLALLMLSGCGPVYIKVAPTVWDTPKEMEARGGGNCRSIAIWKFYQQPPSLTLWLVWGEVNNIPHMWVEDGDKVIDYLYGQRIEWIRFNESIYIKGEEIGNACSIKDWCNTMKRIKEELEMKAKQKKVFKQKKKEAPWWTLDAWGFVVFNNS